MNYTPGPWRWEMNEKMKSVQLCGGKPRFDLIVISFNRWGTQGSTPTFRTGPEGFNIMKPAKEFGINAPNREHHSDWFKLINHPDAKLIEAAPDLLEACTHIFNRMQESSNMSEAAKEHYKEAMDLCESAIKKATE